LNFLKFPKIHNRKRCSAHHSQKDNIKFIPEYIFSSYTWPTDTCRNSNFMFKGGVSLFDCICYCLEWKISVLFYHFITSAFYLEAVNFKHQFLKIVTKFCHTFSRPVYLTWSMNNFDTIYFINFIMEISIARNRNITWWIANK
jgi:hypothetical protein